MSASLFTIKNAISKAPNLQGFDPNACTIVTTDASCKGLGAVLSQINDDKREVVIAVAY